jgi:hypothetical protein
VGTKRDLQTANDVGRPRRRGLERARPTLTPQVSELESIRDRLLEDVEAMTSRIAELEQLAEGTAEEQRRRAAEEERQRRERWAELERLAAARAERQALPRPDAEVVGPARPAAPATATDTEEPPRRHRRRRGRVAAAALAGLALGAAGAAGATAILDSDTGSASRPVAAAAAPKPVKAIPLCSEVPSGVDVVCDTGTRLFITGDGWSADLGGLKARVAATRLEGATAAVDLDLSATRALQLDASPERLYLSVAGRRFGAAPIEPVALGEGDEQTVTLQFLLDQPALDALAAEEGAADLGIVPPGSEPGTRLAVLRLALLAGA